jgi:hypothetical protein
MTQRVFFVNIFNIGIEKAKFDANLESVKKVSRKFTRRKLEGRKRMFTVLMGEKVHKFYT